MQKWMRKQCSETTSGTPICFDVKPRLSRREPADDFGRLLRNGKWSIDYLKHAVESINFRLSKPDHICRLRMFIQVGLEVPSRIGSRLEKLVLCLLAKENNRCLQLCFCCPP